MWIRTIKDDGKEIMINLDHVIDIDYDEGNNRTILWFAPRYYCYIKGTPDRIFELLEQKGMIEVLPLPSEIEDTVDVDESDDLTWGERLIEKYNL